jgi:transposase-like protein
MSEAEAVGRAMAEAAGFCWDHCAQDQWKRDAEAGIRALDTYRAEQKRKTCKHNNRTGSGMVGSSGLSWTYWQCPDCGTTFDSRKSSPASQERK